MTASSLIRVDHVGIAVRSIADAEPFLDLLGCTKLVEETVENRFTWAYYRLGNASRVELIEPVAEESFLTEFLEENGPGLHHVTLEVADIDAAVDHLSANDVRVVDHRAFDDWTEAFLSPRNPTGVLFQLMEYHDTFDDDRPTHLYVDGEPLGGRMTDSESGETGDVSAGVRETIESDPFCETLGIELVELRPGRARTRITVTDETLNFHGTGHGGAVYSLADAAFAAASNSHGETAVALETNISYLSAVDTGTTLEATARETHRTKRTAEYEVVVSDDENDRIATFRGRVYRP